MSRDKTALSFGPPKNERKKERTYVQRGNPTPKKHPRSPPRGRDRPAPISFPPLPRLLLLLLVSLHTCTHLHRHHLSMLTEIHSTHIRLHRDQDSSRCLPLISLTCLGSCCTPQQKCFSCSWERSVNLETFALSSLYVVKPTNKKRHLASSPQIQTPSHTHTHTRQGMDRMELNGGGGGGGKGNQHQHMNGNGFHPTEKTSLVQQAQNAYRLNDVEASRYVCMCACACMRGRPLVCVCTWSVLLAPATSSSSS